jgi:hypothetical protein
VSSVENFSTPFARPSMAVQMARDCSEMPLKMLPSLPGSHASSLSFGWLGSKSSGRDTVVRLDNHSYHVLRDTSGTNSSLILCSQTHIQILLFEAGVAHRVAS